MELTKKERLILYNQYEILKSLNPDEKEYYEIDQEILINGFKYNYDGLVHCFMDDTPEEISQFVIDVLQMYSVLNNSYDKLKDDEKSQIDLYDISFTGFDGNEETDYYVYAKFHLEKLDKFGELKESEYYAVNSHANTLNDYRKMVSLWKEVKTGRYNNVSLKNMQYIIG